MIISIKDYLTNTLAINRKKLKTQLNLFINHLFITQYNN